MHFLTLWQASPQFLGVLANAVGTTRRKTSRRLEFIFFLCSWNWNLKTVTAQHLKENPEYHCDGAGLQDWESQGKGKVLAASASGCSRTVTAQLLCRRKGRIGASKAKQAQRPQASQAPQATPTCSLLHSRAFSFETAAHCFTWTTSHIWSCTTHIMGITCSSAIQLELIGSRTERRTMTHRAIW